MAGNPPEGLGDDFFEQILAVPSTYSGSGSGADSAGGYGDVGSMPMVLQLGSGTGSSSASGGYRGVGSVGMGMGMPLGLNLEQGFLGQDRFRDEVEPNSNNSNNNTNSSNERDSVHMTSLFPAFGHLQNHSVRPTPPPPQPHQVSPDDILIMMKKLTLTSSKILFIFQGHVMSPESQLGNHSCPRSSLVFRNIETRKIRGVKLIDTYGALLNRTRLKSSEFHQHGAL